jgi:hypothetical protein
LGEGGVFGTLAEATEGAATCKFAEGTVQDGEELLSYGDVLGWDDWRYSGGWADGGSGRQSVRYINGYSIVWSGALTEAAKGSAVFEFAGEAGKDSEELLGQVDICSWHDPWYHGGGVGYNGEGVDGGNGWHDVRHVDRRGTGNWLYQTCDGFGGAEDTVNGWRFGD